MSFHSQIKGIMRAAEESVLQICQQPAGWTPVIDEDGNLDAPDNPRQVLVFLCGDREITDPRPADDAGYGIRLGYFDTDAFGWRVHGKIDRYVTHWMELPAAPAIVEQAAE